MSTRMLISWFAVLLPWSTGSLPAAPPTTTVVRLQPPAPAPAAVQQSAGGESSEVSHFKIRSRLLSEYWGRDQYLEAGVVRPPAERSEAPPPVCYSIHGFGGSHRTAWFFGPRLLARMKDGSYPPMLYVFLNASCPMGHHEFADSVNNGPWGQALIEELIPALEAEFGAAGRPAARFLTGHSSGGWSSLWLQVTYPDQFGGTWSTAPDPVDFRDFTGVDIYSYPNAFVDPQNHPIMLVRSQGKWVVSLQDFVKREFQKSSYGGQFASFNAVFSPRGEDGTPMRLFNVDTGVIDSTVAEAWRKYDISWILRNRWPELKDKLAGKLHVYVGTQDTFRLEGAVRLLRDELTKLGSDAKFAIVEGRDHGTLMSPHPRLWPQGLLEQIHREMWDRFRSAPDGSQNR